MISCLNSPEAKPMFSVTTSNRGFGTMQFKNLKATKTFHHPPFFYRNSHCCCTIKNCRNSKRVFYDRKTNSPLLPHCLSQCEVDRDASPDIMCPPAGGIVALGKFDALHIGHRELAIQAAKMGSPYLLSFVGMAEVLGWEPRASIVAQCDRQRVLSTWSQLCNGTTPRELIVEFSKVRSLTPHQFVEKLSKELGVCGVVAGENYRFGYRAAGNSSDLVTLCREYDIDTYIVRSLMDKNRIPGTIKSGDTKDQGQVSSTRVRLALANGDMGYVSELLGRNHRLILHTQDPDIFSSARNRISVPVSCLLNLPPKDGVYENCSLYIDDNRCNPCRAHSLFAHPK